MTSEELKARTKAFALWVVKLVDAIPRSAGELLIGRQLLCCATSVGANYQAACRAPSRDEFAAKLSIGCGRGRRGSLLAGTAARVSPSEAGVTGQAPERGESVAGDCISEDWQRNQPQHEGSSLVGNHQSSIFPAQENTNELAVQDLRYGLRMLGRSPGFATVAVITLALGIGANTAIFSLVNAALLRNLPVRDPGRLALFADDPGESMSVDEPTPGEPVAIPSGQWTLFSYPAYRDLRDHSQLFEGICAFQTTEDTLTVRMEGLRQDAAVQVAQGKLVSGNFFSVLGVNALLGRTLMPADDRPGAAPVAVVSFDYWQNKLGGNPALVGRGLDIDGVPMTLVGVAPRGFFGERVEKDSADFWMPLSLRPRLTLTVMPEATSLLTNPNAYWLDLMGRLKPGVTRQQANAAMDVVLREYLTARAGSKMTGSVRREIQHAYISLAPGGRGLSKMRFEYSEPLYILLAVVGLVLLIACANVANLLLSRATGRQREMAMRLALGATRSRLVRQMLVESLLLAIFGGLAGAFLAAWGVSALVSLVATQVPLNVRPDLAVFGFTMGVSLLTVILSGLAPALRATRLDLVPALKAGSADRAFRSAALDSQRETADLKTSSALRAFRFGLGKGLVVFQIAVSLLLLIGAGLLIHSLLNLENQNLGFSPEHVLLVSADPELARYKANELPALYREIVERIRALPGVRSASIGGTSPMSGSQMGVDVSAEGQPRPRGGNTAQLVPVGPQYFETEGMRILAGRAISSEDTATSSSVAVVNQAFARRFLPKESPVGRRISLGSSFQAPVFAIVGVVEDAKYADAGEEASPMFFLSAYQPIAGVGSMFAYVNEIEIRAAGSPAGAAAEVRRAIHQIDSNLPITGVTTLTQQVNDSLGQQQAISDLTGFFGILGLVLACVGLYGVMAYNVARRTKEIGIRMALGAQQGAVLWMVLRESLLLIAVGIAIGVPVALAAAHLIASQLYGLTPSDPLTIAIAALVMAGVGLLAGFLPACRASRVNPMVALRYE
jgi:macrolide transport system ATP-binding/permease protein